MDSFDHTLIQLTATLTHAARAYKSMADRVASEFGLSQATALPVLILGRLGEHGVRPGVLAEALGLEASSLVRVVDLLIENGLLERRDDPQDRRARLLQLTNEGRTRAAQMEAALIPFRREVFAGIDPADIATCLRVLTAIGSPVGKPGDGATGEKPA
ncbi:MAG: MarR family transcriptional regulator, transcriptional regulator for hemolysin [Massilia sp.]|jgi:MarR family transcriptional regulator for hemolysin